MPLHAQVPKAIRNVCLAFAFTVLLALPSIAQFTPSDDAAVNSASPNTNYGAAATLGVESPSQVSYIRFDLTAVPPTYTGAQVAKATLKLFVNSVTTAGNFNIDVVAGSWSEKTITYDLQPAIGTTIATAVPLTTANKSSYIEVDITSAVQSWLNGTEPNDGIVLVANSPLIASFMTKENTGMSHPAELDIVFYGSGEQGPAGPTGQGAQGFTGPSGPIGPVGSAGPTGPVGLQNRGTWSPNTQYELNDSVSYDGSSWIALLSNLDSAPNSTNPNWQLLAAKGINNQGSWVQTINYQVDDGVTDGGQFWLAIAPNVASEPSLQNPNWQLIAAQGTPGPTGIPGPQGPQGAVGPLGPAGPQGSAGPSGPIGPVGPTGPAGTTGPAGPAGINNRGIWAAGVNYNLNDAVTDQGQYWLAIVSNPSVEPSKQGTPPSWQLIAAQGAAGGTGPAGPVGPTGPQGPAGTGTINGVSAGVDLLGGGTTGTVTMNLDTTKVPQLAAANTFTNSNVISVTNYSAPALQVTNGGTQDGIDVYPNGGGAGVVTGGGYVGVYAYGAGIPIYGTLGPVEGVYGDSNTNAYLSPGILGIENGATEGTVGVFGEVASVSGAGVYGQNQATQSTTGSQSVYGAGVWGDSGTQGFAGVLGTSDSGIAGYFINSGTGEGVTLRAYDTDSTGFPFYAATPGGGCSVDGGGNLSCTGSKNAVVPIDGGQRIVALSAIESPKNWFEDFGSMQLSNGVAVIAIEPEFSQTVNTEQNYHIYLTPNGDCKGLYISQKTPTSFEVRELGGGTSSVNFDYRIVALRKNFEDIRLKDHTHDLDALKPAGSKPAPERFDLNKLIPKRPVHAPEPVSQMTKK